MPTGIAVVKTVTAVTHPYASTRTQAGSLCVNVIEAGKVTSVMFKVRFL